MQLQNDAAIRDELQYVVSTTTVVVGEVVERKLTIPTREAFSVGISGGAMPCFSIIACI